MDWHLILTALGLFASIGSFIWGLHASNQRRFRELEGRLDYHLGTAEQHSLPVQTRLALLEQKQDMVVEDLKDAVASWHLFMSRIERAVERVRDRDRPL